MLLSICKEAVLRIAPPEAEAVFVEKMLLLMVAGAVLLSAPPDRAVLVEKVLSVTVKFPLLSIAPPSWVTVLPENVDPVTVMLLLVSLSSAPP